MAARLQSTIDDWFTPEFLKENPAALEEIRKHLLSRPREGYINCIWATRGLNYIDRRREIKISTSIIVGKEDFGTPVEVTEIMHERIEGSELVILPTAAHLSSVAQPEAFNAAFLEFLRKQ